MTFSPRASDDIVLGRGKPELFEIAEKLAERMQRLTLPSGRAAQRLLENLEHAGDGFFGPRLPTLACAVLP